MTFPVVKGTVRSAKGHLGAFEIVVDDFATAAPSSRDALAFGPGRDGAVSSCDVILDYFRQRAALFGARFARRLSARRSRRSDGVLRAVIKARDLVGTFDKPRYIAFNEELCAPIPVRASSAATAASISVRPARSSLPAIMSQSTPTFAPAAVNALPCARPAPPPTRFRPPIR